MRSKVANPDKIALSFAVLSLLIFVGIKPVLGIIPDNIGVWAFIALTATGLVSTVAALLLGFVGWDKRKSRIALLSAVIAEVLLITVLIINLANGL